jgi:4-amino-4-deoxy-L-arabinose transferase-like glycosyltransferase
VVVPLIVALASSAFFIGELPIRAPDDAIVWVAPLGLDPLGDDSIEYVRIAEALAERQAYEFAGEPTRMRPPLYPLLMAGLGGEVRAIQWAQAGMTLLSILATFLLGRLIWSTRVGFLGALALAAFPPFTVRSALLMSEALFIVTFLWCLYASVKAATTRDIRWLIAAAVLLGLATLARPVTIFFPIVLIPAIMLDRDWRSRARTSARPIALFLLAFSLVLMPWMVRNAVTLGVFTPLPSSGGVNLWAATHPNWKGFVDKHMAYAWELPEFFEISAGDYYISPEADARFRDAALRNIASDPVGWVSRNTVKLSAVAYASVAQELRSAAEVSEFTGNGKGALRLVGAGTLVAMALAVVGVLASLKRRGSWILLSTIGYLYGIEFLSFAEARHLLPLVPLYGLFAVAGLAVIAPVISRWLEDVASVQQEPDGEREQE